MLSNEKYLLIDFSNLVYVSFFSCAMESKLDTENIPPYYNTHLHTFTRKLEWIHRRHPMHKIIFALDQRPTEKYEIYPEYKKRDKKLICSDGSKFDPREIVLAEIAKRGATVVYAKDREADDAIASFVAQNFYSEIVVVSTDKDLWAILDHKNVRLFNMVKNEYVNKTHLRESFCIKDKHKVLTNWIKHYSQIKLWKTLWGDSSDNIPNAIPRMKKQLLPFVNASDGTWEDFKKKLDYGQLTKKCKELLLKNEEQIKINSKLVDLKYNCDLIVEIYKPEPPKVRATTQPIPIDDIF